MKQVIQHLKSGVLEVADVPCPAVSAGRLLVRTRATLISAGTERSLVEFGKANLLSKVRQNPERVKQVLEKIKSDGLLPTLEAVFAKLDEPLPLGYCNAGEVLAVGAGVERFQVGDRVASNGAHAQVVNVPVNLCAKIPDNVDDDQAAFTVLSAIGLQGIRLLAPTLGERVAVFGLGLIGLVSVQMLVANGARVLGIDVDPGRLELARQFGAETVDIRSGADPVAVALAFSGGVGMDGVLITASAKEDQIVSQSARMSRKRGRIVLIGVVNLALNRAEFYEKELSFQVSCSYGPGRYDADYEERGRDYPLPFVRWTEQRNMEAVLGLLADRKLDVNPLITSRLPLNEAAQAYDLLSNDRQQLGLILQYPEVPSLERVVVRTPVPVAPSTPTSKVGVGVIGAGIFTKGTLLPALRQSGATLVSIASASGVTAADAARKYSFQKSTTDYRTLLSDPAINTIFITTRHNLHVPMVVAALEAGKHVFVEKPLAIDQAGLDQVRAAFERTTGLQLMVGFNRRYSPHAVKIRQLLTGRAQPVCMNMLVNAGTIPPEHWVHDPIVGGGRIIGEGCHWIDLLSSLVGAPVTEVQGMSIGDAPGVATPDDKTSLALRFADGSLGNLHYFANGARAYPKEQLQIFSQGRVLELDNFRKLTAYGWSNFTKLNLFRQDKGHVAEITGFVQRIAAGGAPFLEPAEIWNVTAASLAAVEAAKKGCRIAVT
ncbi:MAG: bi-domain-containing oxidoreductase [Planctomycetaceae bacterium]|nr:bi-domain-containing oxidoreductase [Planctomycetaceae bacterium]